MSLMKTERRKKLAKNRFLRTCITCREAKDKEQLYRFVVVENKVILDFYNKINSRGFYVCKSRECIEDLNIRRIKNSLKKDIDVYIDKKEIFQILKINLEKKLKSYLHLSKKSGNLVGTVNRYIEQRKSGKKFKIVFLGKDISENSLKKLKPYLDKCIVNTTFFTKRTLGEIFNKDKVNIAAIEDCRFAGEIINILDELVNIFEGAYINGYGENS